MKRRKKWQGGKKGQKGEKQNYDIYSIICLDFSSNEEVKFFRLEKLADYWLVL